MQAPWLLVYLASKQREVSIKAAAQRRAEARRARQAPRRSRRGCKE